jgi:hypothetical protein
MAISHQGGLSALLKPQALTPELLNTLPMPAALLPTVTDHTAGQHHTFGVQLVFHVGVRPDKPRRLWIAVRAARTVDTPADDELTLALRRVRPTLGRAAVTAEPLAEEQALAGLAHVTGGRNEVREDWRFWRTGAVSQATFQLTGSDRRAGPPSRQHAARWHPRRRRDRDAARAYRTPGDPRTGTAPRLAATTEAAADAMTARLAQSGVRLARLDRAHLSGVAASLPIGVFLS